MSMRSRALMKMLKSCGDVILPCATPVMKVIVTLSSSFGASLTVVPSYVCSNKSHTTQMGYSDVSPGVGMRHLEGPKNPDGLNLGIHVFIYVYKVHMCTYMLGGGMRSWINCFFL